VRFFTNDSHIPPSGLTRHCNRADEWPHSYTCTFATVDLALITFLFLSVSSAWYISKGHIFSSIKSLIALGYKKSIKPVTADEITDVCQEAANRQRPPPFLVVDNMLSMFCICYRLLLLAT